MAVGRSPSATAAVEAWLSELLQRMLEDPRLSLTAAKGRAGRGGLAVTAPDLKAPASAPPATDGPQWAGRRAHGRAEGPEFEVAALTIAAAFAERIH